MKEISIDNISEVEMNKLTELDLLEPFGESSSYIIVIYQTKILVTSLLHILFIYPSKMTLKWGVNPFIFFIISGRIKKG